MSKTTLKLVLYPYLVNKLKTEFTEVQLYISPIASSTQWSGDSYTKEIDFLVTGTRERVTKITLTENPEQVRIGLKKREDEVFASLWIKKENSTGLSGHDYVKLDDEWHTFIYEQVAGIVTTTASKLRKTELPKDGMHKSCFSQMVYKYLSSVMQDGRQAHMPDSSRQPRPSHGYFYPSPYMPDSSRQPMPSQGYPQLLPLPSHGYFYQSPYMPDSSRQPMPSQGYPHLSDTFLPEGNY